MANSCPSRALSSKDLLRKELVAGKRADGRNLLDFASPSISELKCSNPEDVLVIGRIGDTRVSCLLSLEIREADPELDLIHLKVTTADAPLQKTAREQDEGDSEDEVEMDNHEDKSSINLEREAAFETLLEELELIDETRLILLPGRLVLHLNVTINVLQNNGSVIDAGFLALIAALERLALPKANYDATEDAFSYSWEELHSVGALLQQRHSSSTFAVLGSQVLCGPSADEEKSADAVVLTVAGSEESLVFLQVIDGSLPPGFTGLLYDQLVKSSFLRRKEVENILNCFPTEDVLIEENKTVRLSSKKMET